MCKFAPKSELKVAQGRLLRILLVQTHLYAYASGHYERVHGKRVVLMNQKKRGLHSNLQLFIPFVFSVNWRRCYFTLVCAHEDCCTKKRAYGVSFGILYFLLFTCSPYLCESVSSNVEERVSCSHPASCLRWSGRLEQHFFRLSLFLTAPQSQLSPFQCILPSSLHHTRKAPFSEGSK